jgi:hypothetical protein
MSRPTRIARRAAVFAVTLGVALVAVELAWRLRPTSGHGPTTNPRYVEHDPSWGWRYKAGARVRHTTEEFDVEVAINAHCFREQASMPGAGPDLVVLGDSYAFGWGVEGDETFAARLEQLTGHSVWNLAVSGTGTDQQLLVLRHRGRLHGSAAPAFAPQTVLVLFCGNDLVETTRSVSYRRLKPRFELADGELVLVGSPVPEPLLERHSQLYRSVVGRLRERAPPPLSEAELLHARELVLALFAEMAAEAEQLGAELLVLHEGVEWLAVGLGDAARDLRPALIEAATVRPVRFERDGHWNAHGHEAVARAIVSMLDRE